MTDRPETGGPPLSPMDRLGHLLIRAHNGDDLDPFFVEGHPAMAYREDRLVRSCFYYSVVMTPKLTVLYDNDGAGGMCTLDPVEIAAVWRTPELMDSLGVRFEDLQAGTAELGAARPPEPCWRPSFEPRVGEERDVPESGAPGPR